MAVKAVPTDLVLLCVGILTAITNSFYFVYVIIVGVDEFNGEKLYI